MKDKELNKIAAIEKAISKKYGKEAVQNPRGNWDEEKEKDYIEQVKKFQQKKLIHGKVLKLGEKRMVLKKIPKKYLR